MLTNWKIIAIFTPVLFVTYQALSKLLPKGVSIFLINTYASIIGAIIMFSLHLLTSQNKTLTLNNRSLLIALGIGTLISLGNFLIIKAYTLGAPQSLFTSLFYPLLIAYSFFLGIFLWHEKLSLVQIIGTVFSVTGIILIAYFK